jgi:hypothetical protein
MASISIGMIKAGQEIASNMIDADISKDFNSLGGGLSWQQWLNKKVKNQDLILQYINNKITSVEAIYLAMDREADLEFQFSSFKT